MGRGGYLSAYRLAGIKPARPCGLPCMGLARLLGHCGIRSAGKELEKTKPAKAGFVVLGCKFESSQTLPHLGGLRYPAFSCFLEDLFVCFTSIGFVQAFD